jgi:O-succinylbenzoic acid--CoA ligase
VEDVVVFGRPDPVWGAVVTAMVEGAVNVTDVDAWCRANIAGALRPRSFLKVDSIPRNPMGKLDRSKLRVVRNDDR